jgi:hypothetical protein
MKKVNITIFIVFSTIFLLSSCSDDSDDFSVKFPLRDGYSWKYEYTNKIMRVDSAGNQTPIYNDTAQVFVYVKGDTVLSDTLTVKQIEAVWETSGGRIVTASFFQEKEDGLYLIALRNFYAGTIPKKEFSLFVKITGSGVTVDFPRFMAGISGAIISPSAETGDIYYQDPPFHTYAYPLKPGTKWIASQLDDESLTFWREALDWKDIPAAGETRKTVNIKLSIEPPVTTSELDIHEYVSGQGVIERTVRIEGMEERDDEGNPTGNTINGYETLKLTEILSPR